MKISRIYVVTWKQDFHLCRLCIASIRYWYPTIPITLVKDEMAGEFDCEELCRDWNLDLFQTGIRRFGTGFAKLEILFQKKKERYLMVDADAVFLGPVLDCFKSLKADFVIHPEGRSNTSHINALSYNLERLKSLDPSFQAPDFIFNSGQYAATSGMLKRTDFDAFVQWTEPRQLKHPDTFFYGEQGISNYVFFKAWQEKKIRLRRKHFFIWGGHDFKGVTTAHLRAGKGVAYILHWAGAKPEKLKDFKGGEFLTFYHDFYEWKKEQHSVLS